jgi:peptidyl-prolyl cis-trans isomerase SurA
MKRNVSIILIAITVFFANTGSCGAVLLDRVVATVNDEVITWSELVNVIVIEGKEYLSKSGGKEKEAKIRELERPYLDRLIEMKLQIQEARKLGLYVDGSEIDGAVDEIRKKFSMTDEVFLNSLKAEGLTLDDYRTRLADQILLQKVVNFAVKSNIVISAKEIEEYYAANREQFNEKEKRKIRQIFFVLPEDESQKTAVEVRAGEVMRRIREGGDFAELAGKFSEGPSRHFGGDIGYISRGSVLKEIEDVSFALNIGEVSGPFWSPAGLHIIKIEEKTAGGELEKVRDRIKEDLFMKNFELKYYEWKAGLREKAHIEIKL